MDKGEKWERKWRGREGTDMSGTRWVDEEGVPLPSLGMHCLPFPSFSSTELKCPAAQGTPNWASPCPRHESRHCKLGH